jgi:hypothetical protein
MELAILDIKQDGLFAIPARVWQQKEREPKSQLSVVLYCAKEAGHALGMYGLVAFVDFP